MLGNKNYDRGRISTVWLAPQGDTITEQTKGQTTGLTPLYVGQRKSAGSCSRYNQLQCVLGPVT